MANSYGIECFFECRGYTWRRALDFLRTSKLKVYFELFMNARSSITRCQYVLVDGSNGTRGERGLYHRSEEVGLCKDDGPSSGAPSPCLLGSQGDEVEGYAGSDKEEKDEA